MLVVNISLPLQLSLSCTVSQILSLIFPSFNKSRDPAHIHAG